MYFLDKIWTFVRVCNNSIDTWGTWDKKKCKKNLRNYWIIGLIDILICRGLRSSDSFKRLQNAGVPIRVESLFHFVQDFEEQTSLQRNSRGNLHVIIDPLTTQSFQVLQNITDRLRLDTDSILFTYGGEVEDFHTFPLVFDSGFFIINNTKDQVVMSLYKVQPNYQFAIIQTINWKTEGHKLGYSIGRKYGTYSEM